MNSPLPIPFSLNKLSLLVGLACSSVLSAHAQSLLPASSTANSQVVVISGSRYEQLMDELPVSMDVLSAKDLESGMIGDIRDLSKNLPNISVKHAPSRFTVTGVGNATGRDSNAGFNIRGQEGNRVLMLVDGVRLPRSYINGSNAFGRDSLSLDLLKRIEIVRGPASVLYGSDGLAGLVNFITHEPADFLHPAGAPAKTFGGKVSLSYSGDDNGKSVSATLAGRATDQLEWLVTATGSRADGLKNMGTNDVANVDRTTPNPQKDKGNSVLAKLVYRPNDQQKHVFTVEHVNKDSDVELLSSRAKPPVTLASAVVGESASKSMTRDRATLSDRYKFDTVFADHLQTVLSFQDASAQDDGVTHRKTLADRVRNTSYRERAWQANVQADKMFRMTEEWSQRLSYGVDYARTDVSNFFDGVDPGNAGFVARKYFPDTRESTRALFAQSEIMSGKLSVTPGIRFDHFDLDVTTQTGFYPPSKTPGKSLSGSAVTPKLGALYRATAAWSVFGNFAGGFRAPNAQQVNGTFDSSTIAAVLLPNPDLKSEKSKNLEFGVRGVMDKLSVDFAAFTGKYDNLIYDKKPLGGRGVTGDPAIFQTVNIDKATIYGFELKGNVNWGSFADAKWSTPFSYGITHGTDDSTDLPLNSIIPAKLHAGLKMELPMWDVRLDARYQEAKREGDLDSPYLPKPALPPRIKQFTIPSALTLDLSGQWRIRNDLRLNAGVANITNKKYWNWSDVQGLAATSVVTDAYTQAGRHYSMSLVMDF